MGVVSPYVVRHMALVAKRSANRDVMAEGAPYRSLPRGEVAVVTLGSGKLSRLESPLTWR
jgi:hypothetical protein